MAQKTLIALSDITCIEQLEQEAFDKNMDVDYETLTLKIIGTPGWHNDPEEDIRESYE